MVQEFREEFQTVKENCILLQYPQQHNYMVLEKDGEDQLDRTCEKRRSVT